MSGAARGGRLRKTAASATSPGEKPSSSQISAVVMSLFHSLLMARFSLAVMFMEDVPHSGFLG